MQVIKSEKGELWIVKDGYTFATGKELNVDEARQKAYVIAVIGNFKCENDKILQRLSNSDKTSTYAHGDILSNGSDVYLLSDIETIDKWYDKFSSSADDKVMDIIEQTTDIEELKTLLRAVTIMPEYNLLKVGFLEEITEAIINQTKKQLRNAEG